MNESCNLVNKQNNDRNGSECRINQSDKNGTECKINQSDKNGTECKINQSDKNGTEGKINQSDKNGTECKINQSDKNGTEGEFNKSNHNINESDKNITILKGKECHIYNFGDQSEALILLGTFSFTGQEESSLITNLQTLCKNMNFTLATFYVSDWNAEFSPWPAEDSNGNPVFPGGGRETLTWIKNDLMPYLKSIYQGDIKYYIAGYSLSGLFALWSFYESKLFQGVASCSGSLWMDGWDEYIKNKKAPENSLIYLSLGGKEEKTKDAKMALVGDRTRQMEKIAISDPNVRKQILEWNKGGHFADSGKRLAKGICWLLSNRDF